MKERIRFANHQILIIISNTTNVNNFVIFFSFLYHELYSAKLFLNTVSPAQRI